LFNAGIPYRVFGGLRFFERAEVKHALAYLRLMDNPHEDNAFLRVVNFPTRGIGARSIEQLSDLAKARGCSLYEAASALDGKAGTSVRGFVQMIESLRFETQGLPLHEMVTAMLDRSGLVRHFETEKEGRERIENLRELVNAAAAFVADEGLVLEAPANMGVTGAAIDDSGEIFSSPLSMFLAHASLEAGDNQASEGQDAVQLMTIHSAKGLEFNVVFITGLEEGLFPHENSLSELDGLEEERRLMYVAITRARRRLYISLAQTRMLHGQTRYNMRSRFLDELPEGALKWLAPRIAQRTAQQGFFTSGRSSVSSFDPDASMHAKRVSADTPYLGGPARLSGQTHDSGFRIGQAVSHARFGEGVVTALEGSGQDARAQVQFKRAGSKWLALSVAKLDRA
ncbi:MAG: hypothetical protein RLZZ290_4, partial [Pseudomonadota bacterium]